jgi:alpha-galactosidase
MLRPVLALFACALLMHAAETLWLDELPLDGVLQEWRVPQKNKSVEGNPLRIAGKTYERGIGTHANSRWGLDLQGAGSVFSAEVGVDDEIGGNAEASIEFQVVGDGRLLWKSGVMRAKQPAKTVQVDVSGIQRLKLLVSDMGDNKYDHADWAMAKVTYDGKKPTPLSYKPRPPYILTPKPPKTPRINGARVFGARPDNPFLFTIPATGERPMTFAVEGLPAGLQVDAKTGRITGSVAKAGTYTATLVARNALGEAKRELRIEIGETICLTPPMGWNSWNCWARAVDAEKVLSSAKAMAESGLINHGWSYVNIDDAWQAKRGGPFKAIQPNEKFPDMKALADQVHGMGLKLGIYSTPWITSYAGFVGGSADQATGEWTHIADRRVYSKKGHRHGKVKFDVNDALQWADWGIDYLKYDWHPIDANNTEAMGIALRMCGRDIVYSLSNSARISDAPALSKLANCWRTTGDIRDTWNSMAGIGFAQDKWFPYASPGHWNDPDMLVVGLVGWGPRLHPSRLSADEQYTHISLWCLLASPLLIGCDMARMDEFTLSLLTNDEVLEVNQDPKGDQAKRIAKDGDMEVWAKTMHDGSRAVGIFNRSIDPAKGTVAWKDLELSGKQRVRDLWRQQDLGEATDFYTTEVPAHGVVLLRLFPVE